MESTLAIAPDATLFASLVRRRWSVSLSLTALMLTVYYGFIAVLAFRSDLLATTFVGQLPVGLPVGLGVILTSWLLTGIYVRWANDDYDVAVARLKETMQEERQ